MPIIEIDLTQQLDNYLIEKLQNFFKGQTDLGINQWGNKATFEFADGTQFKFVYPVLQRKRKENREGFRYEIVALKEPLGKGAFATVYEVEGTLQFTEQGSLFKKQGKDGLGRALKVETHSTANPLTNKEREYNLLRAADHLAVKEPIWDGGNLTYLVMNRIAGRTLFDIIQDDYTDVEVLTNEQRFELSRALLLALKEQITSKGIIHRDIKPENIYVDMEQKPIKVTILDFGFSIFANEPDGAQCGTRTYVAPEITYRESSYKSDAYSMARVIAMVWQVGLKTYEPSSNSYINNSSEEASNSSGEARCNFEWSLKDRLEDLFGGMSLQIEQRNEIYRVLSGMLKTDPEKRYSIDQALSKFPSHETYDPTRQSIGQYLLQVLKDDFDNSKPLTIKQRFELSNALLNAVKKQLTAKRIVHGGLNPETISVDLENSCAVTILDYGLGFDEEMGFDGDIPDGQYFAPEFINSSDVNNKADVYSIALILALIWHIDLDVHTTPSNEKYLGFPKNKSFAISLPMSEDLKFEISYTLEKMLAFKPKDRYSIYQAIVNFPTRPMSCVKSKENSFIKRNEIPLNRDMFFKKAPIKKINPNTIIPPKNIDFDAEVRKLVY